LKALFDLSFTKFISPSIAKIVYVLIMVVIGLTYLIAVIASFRVNAVIGLLVLIIVGPIVALLYLVLARVGLESLIAAIRTAENTAELVRLSGGGRPNAGPGAPANYPYAPQYPPASPTPPPGAPGF
jgi:hypothetical protein